MVLKMNFRQIKDEGINTKGLIESMYSYIYNQEFVALPYTLLLILKRTCFFTSSFLFFISSSNGSE